MTGRRLSEGWRDEHTELKPAKETEVEMKPAKVTKDKPNEISDTYLEMDELN
ncbi:hypothetical protein YC2023_094721 [Brassica napus]